jgi:hypothetical protein
VPSLRETPPAEIPGRPPTRLHLLCVLPGPDGLLYELDAYEKAIAKELDLD